MDDGTVVIEECIVQHHECLSVPMTDPLESRFEPLCRLYREEANSHMQHVRGAVNLAHRRRMRRMARVVNDGYATDAGKRLPDQLKALAH